MDAESWVAQGDGVRQVLELARHAESLGPDGFSALPELASRIRSESARLSYPLGEAQSLLLEAKYHAYRDEYFEALNLAGEALEQFVASSSALGQAKAHGTLGYAYGQLGRLNESMQHFQEGLTLLEQNGGGDPEADAVAGNLRNNLASVYGDLGRYDEAIDVLQRVLTQAEKAGGAPLVEALTNLCEAHMNKGSPMNAMVCNQRALVEIRTNNLGNMHLFHCHSNFGRLYEISGQHEKASASYTEALDAAMRMNNRYSMASAFYSLGALEWKAGCHGEAAEALEQALELASEIHANELCRSIGDILAQAYEAMQDYKRAYELLRSFAELNRDMENRELDRKLSHYFAEIKIEQARKDSEIHRLKNVELRQKTEEIERKALELENSYRNIKAISEIGQRITNTLDVSLVLSTIFENVRDLMDTNIFAIGLCDEALGIIDYKIFIEDSCQRPLFQVSADDERSIAASVLRTGKETLLRDGGGPFTENETVHAGQNSADRPMSSICCPLTLADRITGVILVQSRKMDAYSERNLETVKALASFIAIALNNSRQSEELKAKARELELASRTDPLTGLFNRRHVIEKIEEERVRHKRSGRPFSLIICDIDFFKKVNDVYGHDCGDAALKALAGLLGRHIRRQDTLARWGGEEFLMLLPDTASGGAAVLAEKLRKRIEEYEFIYAGLKIPLTLTFGVAQYNDDYGVDACIVGADSALYKGKSDGRNCVVVF